MSPPEEMVDLLIQKMQTSHLDESRIMFVGDLYESETNVQSLENLCITVKTGNEPSMLASLMGVFCRRVSQLEEQHPVRVRAGRISEICFSHYSFYEFPPDMMDRRGDIGNGGDIFPNVRFCCEIDQCTNLTSLRTIIAQFPNIVLLKVQRCPMLKSIESLSGGCPNLELLSIQDCGLVCKPEELENNNSKCSWDSAFEALSRNRGQFELILRDCKALNTIPPSIQLLRNKLMVLSLDDLPNLKYLPSEIGALASLSLLRVTNTGITSLPPEIGRLDPSCAVFIQGEIVCPPKCYRGSIAAMKKYFTRRRMKVFKGFVLLSILFHRARSRAIERLFRPGGGGYKRCQDRFILMSRKRSK